MAAFEFRRVRPGDFAYCWSIYSEAMGSALRETIERALDEEGASILVVDKSDAGWLHVSETRFDIHLGHLYLEADRRGQGLGTGLLQWMIDRARRKAKSFTVDVAADSRARRLYERLGFVPAGKIRMQHRAS